MESNCPVTCSWCMRPAEAAPRKNGWDVRCPCGFSTRLTNYEMEEYHVQWPREEMLERRIRN